MCQSFVNAVGGPQAVREGRWMINCDPGNQDGAVRRLAESAWRCPNEAMHATFISEIERSQVVLFRSLSREYKRQEDDSARKARRRMESTSGETIARLGLPPMSRPDLASSPAS